MIITKFRLLVVLLAVRSRYLPGCGNNGVNQPGDDTRLPQALPCAIPDAPVSAKKGAIPRAQRATMSWPSRGLDTALPLTVDRTLWRVP
jgi:hypothetical protein